MTNNNIGLHHGAILLTAAVLFLIPSLVCGQTRSAKSSGDRENSEISFSSLADAYRELSQVIERESKELEELKLDGASPERISEARRNAELAQRIDSGLAQLEKIRLEKNRLIESFQQSELADGQASVPIGSSHRAPASLPSAGVPSVEVANSPLQNRLPASVIELSTFRHSSSAKSLGLSANPVPGAQARFRMPCGCLAEVHMHQDAAGRGLEGMPVEDDMDNESNSVSAGD